MKITIELTAEQIVQIVAQAIGGTPAPLPTAALENKVQQVIEKKKRGAKDSDSPPRPSMVNPAPEKSDKWPHIKTDIKDILEISDVPMTSREIYGQLKSLRNDYISHPISGDELPFLTLTSQLNWLRTHDQVGYRGKRGNSYLYIFKTNVEQIRSA